MDFGLLGSEGASGREGVEQFDVGSGIVWSALGV